MRMRSRRVNSPAFGHGHAGTDKPHLHTGGPVSVSSELWSYEISTTSPGQSPPTGS